MKKIGFIGAGDISMLHGNGIRCLEGAELVGLWNVTQDLAEEKSEIFGCRIYGSAEELVNDPQLDAVFILTNVETHAFYANLAMNAGKHVLVEKPVAASLEELESMKETALKNGVILMPGHNYLHEEGLRRTKDLIRAGRLGEIAQVYVMYNIQHPEEVAMRYPGVIRQLMIHHLYILIYLVGPPAGLMAMKSTIGYEELKEESLAMVLLSLPGGGMAHLAASFANDDHSSDAWTFQVKVMGTKGSTRFSYNDWVENSQAIVHSHTYSAYHYHIQNEIQYFIEECLGKGADPPSSIDDAITCQRLIEGIEESIKTRGWVNFKV